MTDNEFRFLARISPEFDQKNYQTFVEGVVRGAMCNLGVEPCPVVEVKMLSNVNRQYPVINLKIRCGSQRKRSK